MQRPASLLEATTTTAMRISSNIIAAALLLSSEVCAAQVVEETTIAHRRRKVKIYSSSSIRRGELNRDAVDPFLGLPDERDERHLQGVPLEGSMSVPIASNPGSFSLPITTTTTTVAPATTTEPKFCIEVYEPVCGEDGTTYSNACKADLANVAVAYEGECKKPTTTSAPEEPESTSTTIAPDTVDVTTDTVDVTTTAATTYVLPMPDDEFTPSPTPFQKPTQFPTKSLGVNFQARDEAPSSAMAMGQSGIVLATAMCAVAGMVALM